MFHSRVIGWQAAEDKAAEDKLQKIKLQRIKLQKIRLQRIRLQRIRLQRIRLQRIKLLGAEERYKRCRRDSLHHRSTKPPEAGKKILL